MTIFIPQLSTQAGACLTMANWQEVGIGCVAYSLSALLIKPGLDVLRKCPDLKTYVGWQNELVLNASMLSVDAQGTCRLRSSFDGGCLIFDFEALISLMVQLAPHYVLLPKKFPTDKLVICAKYSNDITFFVHGDTPILWDEYPHFGVYVDASTSDLSTLTESLQPFQHRLKYVIGGHEVTSYAAMSALDIAFIESDKPARDALQGWVYVSQATQRLSCAITSQTMIFDVIDKNCQCPTCLERLSRAYLCHLYTHTPLLCQRFLIQHNIFQIQSEFFQASHLPCL